MDQPGSCKICLSRAATLVSPERWRQVKDVLAASLELEAAQRPAHLAAVCAGDPALAREVESLLASFGEASTFLEEPALESVEDAAGGDLSGQRIGAYRLDSLIAHGGMGSVYRATRADDFQRQVAVKVVKRGMDTDALLERFRTERQILARLDHPHIARLLDGGATADGRPYLVME